MCNVITTTAFYDCLRASLKCLNCFLREEGDDSDGSNLVFRMQFSLRVRMVFMFFPNDEPDHLQFSLSKQAFRTFLILRMILIIVSR